MDHFYMIEEHLGNQMFLTHTRIYPSREKAQHVIDELNKYYASKELRVVRYETTKGKGPERVAP